MRPIAPRIAGLEEVTIAEEQLEFAPITAALLRSEHGPAHDERICRWTLSEHDRARIAAGEDVYFLTLASIKLCLHRCSGWAT